MKCLDCNWMSPKAQVRGVHGGWFPDQACVDLFDETGTYPDMENIQPEILN